MQWFRRIICTITPLTCVLMSCTLYDFLQLTHLRSRALQRDSFFSQVKPASTLRLLCCVESDSWNRLWLTSNLPVPYKLLNCTHKCFSSFVFVGVYVCVYASEWDRYCVLEEEESSSRKDCFHLGFCSSWEWHFISVWAGCHHSAACRLSRAQVSYSHARQR